MDWTVGLKEEDLHEDGTPKTGGILPPSLQGVRVMGGGEMKKFYNPIVAGTDLYLTTEVIDTHVKEGKKVLLPFLYLKILTRMRRKRSIVSVNGQLLLDR